MEKSKVVRLKLTTIEALMKRNPSRHSNLEEIILNLLDTTTELEELIEDLKFELNNALDDMLIPMA